jgi:dTDP-4-dehydrorhamnose 3,5-epimerase-like enzyme
VTAVPRATIADIRRIPLRLFEDERGWFCELRRESLLPEPTGLHWHARGQSDLFACLQGMARVVVLDRETGETFTEDIGTDNPVAIWIPGTLAHGFEALTDLLFCYHVTREYDPAEPDELGVPWNDPRVVHLWSTTAPTLSARDLSAAS